MATKHASFGQIIEDEAPVEDADWWPSVSLRPWLPANVVKQRARTVTPEIPEDASNEQRVKLATIIGQAILRQ
jgi:hypothetical protein